MIMSNMSDEDRAHLVKAVCDEMDVRLDVRKKIPEETHSKHHAYIEMKIEQQEKRDKLAEHAKRTFVGALAVSLVSALAWLGSQVMHYLGRG